MVGRIEDVNGADGLDGKVVHTLDQLVRCWHGEEGTLSQALKSGIEAQEVIIA